MACGNPPTFGVGGGYGGVRVEERDKSEILGRL